MAKTSLRPGRSYKVVGTLHGKALVEIGANGTIRVSVGTTTKTIPLSIVMALQSLECIEFIKDPAVAAFLYSSSERETRIKAAEDLANTERQDLRRAWVSQVLAAGLLDEPSAWSLARVKYP